MSKFVGSGLTRRSFLRALGLTGAAALAAACSQPALAQSQFRQFEQKEFPMNNEQIIRHELTDGDRSALASLRAALAANPIAITRASYDGLFEQVPPADAVDYSESSVGGVPGVWC